MDPTRDARIRVTGLGLVDFRNYETLNLAIRSRFVVLHGDNGSGKTNLLEALSLLSPGKGLRRAAYGEIARSTGGAARRFRRTSRPTSSPWCGPTRARPHGSCASTAPPRVRATSFSTSCASSG
jgi:hypothetical protein